MKRLSDYRVSITENEEHLLAIRTGIGPRGYVAQQVTAAARHGALLVKDDRVDPWPIRRVALIDGEYYLVGPYTEGKTLAELLQERTMTEPDWLPALVRAVRYSLNHDDIRPTSLATSLVTTEGAVLMLDARPAREISRSMAGELRKTLVAPYNDDRLTGSAAVVYQLAAIAYHALTGSPPPIQDEDRAQVIPPVHTRAPAVLPEVSSLIDGVLSLETIGDAATLDEILRRVRDNGNRWFENITPDEQAARRESAERALDQAHKERGRRTFWRRHRARIALIAVISIIVGAVPFTMIRNSLQPPSTAGFAPEEVASGFYRAWTELDHIFMDDAVARGVARDIIREVTNIYVMDRVQTAHELHSRFVSPRAWLDAGSPPDRMAYGVSESTIRVVHREPERVTIEAEYYLWRPDQPDQLDQQGQPDDAEIPATGALKTHRRDRMVLAPTRHSWEIIDYSTTILSEERIPAIP